MEGREPIGVGAKGVDFDMIPALCIEVPFGLDEEEEQWGRWAKVRNRLSHVTMFA